MNLRLGAAATYHEQGDIVDSSIYLEDRDAGVYRPQLVMQGTAILKSGDSQIDKTIDFDYRYGTEDGSFRVFFIHPSGLNKLRVHVEMVVLNDGVEENYFFDATVLKEEAEAPALEPQPPETRDFWDDDIDL